MPVAALADCAGVESEKQEDKERSLKTLIIKALGQDKETRMKTKRKVIRIKRAWCFRLPACTEFESFWRVSGRAGSAVTTGL